MFWRGRIPQYAISVKNIGRSINMHTENQFQNYSSAEINHLSKAFRKVRGSTKVPKVFYKVFSEIIQTGDRRKEVNIFKEIVPNVRHYVSFLCSAQNTIISTFMQLCTRILFLNCQFTSFAFVNSLQIISKLDWQTT